RDRAAALGARVLERDWPGHAAQKQFAVEAARHDWVLCIDADERISDALRDELLALRAGGVARARGGGVARRSSEALPAELLALRAGGFAGAAGWSVPRLSSYLGAWIRHGTWYPDRTVRLFDRRRGRFVANPDYDLHEHVIVDGHCAQLRHDLLHAPYRSISEHLQTIDSYTTIMARGLHQRGRRALLSDLIFRPAARFLKFYVVKAGLLDGWRGLLLAYLAAHYVRLKYAKLL